MTTEDMSNTATVEQGEPMPITTQEPGPTLILNQQDENRLSLMVAVASAEAIELRVHEQQVQDTKTEIRIVRAEYERRVRELSTKLDALQPQVNHAQDKAQRSHTDYESYLVRLLEKQGFKNENPRDWYMDYNPVARKINRIFKPNPPPKETTPEAHGNSET